MMGAPLTRSPFVATLGLSALAALAIVRTPRTRRAGTGAARRCCAVVVETLAVATPRLARDACAATAHARVDRDTCATTGRTATARERTATACMLEMDTDERACVAE